MFQAKFSLGRYFRLCSVVVFLVATALFGGLYRYVSIHQLIEQSERANIALTQAFANALWPQFRPYVEQAGGLSGDELRVHPQTARLLAAVQEQMRNLSVVKIKIYNHTGLTVFSTEPSQMGALKSDHPGYLMAMQGHVVSELGFRDKFDSLEGTISDRNVVYSYIPMLAAEGGIEGVFEIYDDVTGSLNIVENLQWTVFGSIGLVFVFVFGILSTIVAHGEALLVLTGNESDRTLKTRKSESSHPSQDGELPDQSSSRSQQGSPS